jgi:hypothetical protein
MASFFKRHEFRRGTPDENALHTLVRIAQFTLGELELPTDA